MSDLLPRVFFSYARSDADFVLEVSKALRAQGRSVWVDQLDIPKGARWDEEVERALKSSNCLLVVLSPASVQSQNVQDEVAYALDEKRTVLPILLQECDIPFRLKRLQYVDFTGDFDLAYEELSSALTRLGAAAGVNDAARSGVRAPGSERPASESDHVPHHVVTAEAPWRAGRRQASRRYVVLGAMAVTAAAGGWFFGKGSFNGGSSEPVAASPAQPPDKPINRPQEAPAILSDAQAKDFVLNYIEAQNSANVAGLLRFYADRVDYFDEKGADHDFIFKDKQNYYRRWPQVDNRLENSVTVVRSAEDSASIKLSYVLQYRVSNPARNETRSGASLNDLKLQRFNNRWYIVDQKERVAPSSASAIK